MLDQTSGCTIRPMTLTDLSVVLGNERAAYPIPWTEAVLSECITGRNLCSVLLLEGEVIGHSVLSVVLDETHLLNLCIAPGYANKGFGRYFLRAMIADAIARQSKVFFLEVRVSNQKAVNLYHSEGFNEVGIRPNYYPAESGREDALLMTLELQIDQYV